MKLLLLCSFVGFTMASLSNLFNLGGSSASTGVSANVNVGANTSSGASAKGLLGAALSGIRNAGSNALSGIGNAGSEVGGVLATVTNTLSDVVNNALSVINGTIAVLKASINKALFAIYASISPSVSNLNTLLAQLPSASSSMMDNLVAGIASSLGQLQGSVETGIASINNISNSLQARINQSGVEELVDNLEAEKMQLILGLIQNASRILNQLTQRGQALGNVTKQAIGNAIGSATQALIADIALKESAINQAIATGRNLTANETAAVLNSFNTLELAFDAKSALLNASLANATAADKVIINQTLNDLKSNITAAICFLQRLKSVVSNNIQVLVDQLIQELKYTLANLPTVSLSVSVSVNVGTSGGNQTANVSSGNAVGNGASTSGNSGSSTVVAGGSANASVAVNATVGA